MEISTTAAKRHHTGLVRRARAGQSMELPRRGAKAAPRPDAAPDADFVYEGQPG